MDITEDVVEFVVKKLSGSLGTDSTDSEAQQGWILKIGKDGKILCTSVEIFVDSISNQSPPWAAYRVFMSGRLIALEKYQVFVRLVLRKPGYIFLLNVY